MFNYKWYKSTGYPAQGVKKSDFKVFSTFACGGGSSMGYKLAGFNVIGANDIDPKMRDIYLANHNVNHFILAPIGDLLKMDLPEELYNLDILDGSPPCSTFSMAGSREKAWKKEKKFREGQAEQVLSDLFFDFIALTEKLKPKVFIAENVKGMLLGNAKAYTTEVIKAFDRAGYTTQLFLLNGGSMGLPQTRERVFFIGTRKDLKLPKIKIDFKDTPITFGNVEHVCIAEGLPVTQKELSEAYKKWWKVTPPGQSFSYAHPKGSFFNTVKVSPMKTLGTITATAGAKITHYREPKEVSDEMLTLCSSFPLDYNYLDNDPKYVTGMSVPPLMMARVAYEVRKQLLEHLPKG